MRLQKHVGIGLVAAGLSLGWAGLSRAQDKPKTEPPAPGEGRPDRGGPETGGGGGNRPRPEPGQMLERLHQQMEKLNLSDEQKTKIKSIIDGARTDLAAAQKESEGLEGRERFEKIRGVLEPVREKLMDVLDETQREKLRENMKAAGFGRGGRGGPDGAPGPRDAQGPRERRGEKDGNAGERGPRRDAGERGGPDGGPRGERPGGDRPGGPGPMIEHLRDSLHKLELNEEQRKKVDALLTETERKMVDLRSEAEKQAIETRGKFRAAMEDNRKQLESILSDEQKAKLKEMMSERGGPRGEGRRGPRPDGPGPGPEHDKAKDTPPPAPKA